MNTTADVTTRARALLARIAELDSQLNCYVAIDEAAVLREAARLDALPPDARGPLHGRTLAVKDLIDVAGLPTRAGSGFFRRDPERDAPVVAALRAAGALVIGKTNTHEFAWGITTENPHFGRTGNPWDPARTPGGSSGGSGAAVAAGLADIALGTDTLGSIRIPSALNGVSGLRPATGALPLDDIVPLALGLDTVGPLARHLSIAQLVYDVLAAESPSATNAVREARPRRVCRLRGGGWDRVEAPVAAALDTAASVLRAGGIAIDDVTWWDDELTGAVAVVQQRAAAQFHAPLFAGDRERYGEDVRARVAQALTLGDADERDARAVVARARASWAAACAGYDVALAPIVGGEAPLSPVPAEFRAATLPLATPASAFGLPAASVPMGFGPAGMPLGMQIVALDGEPAGIFAIGNRYQMVTDWHRRRPADAAIAAGTPR
jgi:aspartyl-tRNA(Asn)/glutamyl-tRNA(Gln) amidotransferase subunit A